MSATENANFRAFLLELLDGKSPEDFDANALGRKGSYRSERKAFLAAAVLFEAAAERARETGQRTAWLEWRIRSGTHFFEAAHVARAIPILRECIAAHLEQVGHRDVHMVEHAYALLLRDAANQGEAEAFRATFAEAVTQCAKVGRPGFPAIHAHQELLLEAAHQLKCAIERDVVAQIIALRRPLPRRVRARLEELGYGELLEGRTRG